MKHVTVWQCDVLSFDINTRIEEGAEWVKEEKVKGKSSRSWVTGWFKETERERERLRCKVRWKRRKKVWVQVGGEGTGKTKKRRRKRRLLPGAADARQPSRQKTAELALRLYQLTTGWQSIQDVWKDRHTLLTRKQTDHSANVQTLRGRGWKDRGEEMWHINSTTINLEVYQIDRVTQSSHSVIHQQASVWVFCAVFVHCYG